MKKKFQKPPLVELEAIQAVVQMLHIKITPRGVPVLQRNVRIPTPIAASPPAAQFVGLCSRFPFLCPPPLFSPVFLLADGFQHSTTGQPGTAALPQVLIPAGVGIPALIPAPSVCPFISRVVQGNLGSAAGSLIQNKHQALRVLSS